MRKKHKVHWLEGNNVDRTLDILDKLTRQLVSWVDRGLFDQDTIYGVALLNEPWGVDQEVWAEVRDNFYPKGYEVSSIVGKVAKLNSLSGGEERHQRLERLDCGYPAGVQTLVRVLRVHEPGRWVFQCGA